MQKYKRRQSRSRSQSQTRKKRTKQKYRSRSREKKSHRSNRHYEQKHHQERNRDFGSSQKLKRQQQKSKCIKYEQNAYYDQNGNLIIKQLPNFQPSGILLEFYNSREGVKLKFHQPPEAQKPIEKWRIYPFKGQKALNPILLKQSNYLIGKDDRICDILCENPSISRQHAVIQFRTIHKQNIQGNYFETVEPYLLDLQSSNGTFLNQQRIQPGRYYQILDRDVAKFGLSDREYVFIKDKSENDQ